MGKQLAEIGIFGGSGLYSLMNEIEEHVIDTPYGMPSARIATGKIDGRKVAFIPRHGKNHEYPAHKVNYRANIFAMKSIGVERIIAPCSCGSLQIKIQPGDFVVIDQFVDRTRGRKDTCYHGPLTTHISAADPYCPELRKSAIDVLEETKYPFHSTGTMVVIQGPRFSTRAESKWFSSNGWDIVGMTQYPEVVLARELEICYTALAIVTDYDVGLNDGSTIEPVTADEVLKVFKENIEKLKGTLFKLVPRIPVKRSCECAKALEKARFV